MIDKYDIDVQPSRQLVCFTLDRFQRYINCRISFDVLATLFGANEDPRQCVLDNFLVIEEAARNKAAKFRAEGRDFGWDRMLDLYTADFPEISNTSSPTSTPAPPCRR